MTLTELQKAMGGVSGYGELRMHTNRNVLLRMVKGNLVTNSVTKTGGVSARVYKDGAWGMASSPERSAEALSAVVRGANSNAGFLGTRMKGSSLSLGGQTGQLEKLLYTQKPRVSAGDKLDFIRALDSYIDKKYPDLVSRTLLLTGIDSEKQLATTDGSTLHTFIPRLHVYLILTTEKDGEPIDLFGRTMGGLGEFEDLFGDPAALYPHIDETYEKLMAKREGIRPQGGLHTCVLAPDLAGILAHEAVGHTVEYDLVKGGSIAGPLLGKQVASNKVSITDFAHTAFGKTCEVPVFADDEGVIAQDAPIIEKGILTGYLHSRASAAEFGTAPMGNGRAFAFNDEPLIRMRNTCILPGTDKLSDMIASVEDGYFLSHPGNGQADLTSEFMFAVNMGYEIKNGKLGRALLDTTVAGVAFDMLKTVTMVSDDCEWVSSGFCGKKQPMSVGMGGPAVLCNINVGGN